ncbi:hypothetical protein [Mucilaginibacter segetis]|uniref:Uncharacterized protein n=1 Tax=Mucilaginibacter segetis TaxID=2793071 RepID=A0A934UP44_9SPHI|nr:hypothetical protein [Mucilaginibacter segetis]MBK0380602.1 hypothetical protein [Mucilaginibacter segetis]
MKPLLFLSVFALILFGCNHGTKHAEANLDELTNHLKPGKHNYLAVFEKDSAKLTLDIGTYGKISGQMSVKYSDTSTVERQATDGTLMKAEFKGDTLRADYSFSSGPSGQNKYVNPVAFLHKGDTLIMGYGRVLNYLGRNYFDPATPIGFEKSKFRFVPVK